MRFRERKAVKMVDYPLQVEENRKKVPVTERIW